MYVNIRYVDFNMGNVKLWSSNHTRSVLSLPCEVASRPETAKRFRRNRRKTTTRSSAAGTERVFKLCWVPVDNTTDFGHVDFVKSFEIIPIFFVGWVFNILSVLALHGGVIGCVQNDVTENCIFLFWESCVLVDGRFIHVGEFRVCLPKKFTVSGSCWLRFQG